MGQSLFEFSQTVRTALTFAIALMNNDQLSKKIVLERWDSGRGLRRPGWLYPDHVMIKISAAPVTTHQESVSENARPEDSLEREYETFERREVTIHFEPGDKDIPLGSPGYICVVLERALGDDGSCTSWQVVGFRHKCDRDSREQKIEFGLGTWEPGWNPDLLTY